MPDAVSGDALPYPRPVLPYKQGQMYFSLSPHLHYNRRRIRQPAVGRKGMEEKPVGAMGVILVLTLTILVFWLGVYALFFARG